MKTAAFIFLGLWIVGTITVIVAITRAPIVPPDDGRDDPDYPS